MPSPGAPQDLPPVQALDYQLVLLCLDNNAEAWKVLYERYVPILVQWLQRRLGRACAKGQLPDEIAHEVLASLSVKEMGRLKKFDPHRPGGLKAYLICLAKMELQRRERKRMTRDKWESPESALDPALLSFLEAPDEMILQDFMTRLSKQEKYYFRVCLLKRLLPGEVPKALHPENAHSLHKRVLAKLRKFLFET